MERPRVGATVLVPNLQLPEPDLIRGTGPSMAGLGMKAIGLQDRPTGCIFPDNCILHRSTRAITAPVRTTSQSNTAISEVRMLATSSMHLILLASTCSASIPTPAVIG